MAEQQRQRRLNNPEKTKALAKRSMFVSRLKKFGITEEEHKSLIKLQNNLCAICSGPQIKNKSLSIDHNHVTKQVRGLLCDHCNTAIGKFREDVQIMHKAIEYLNHYNDK